MPDDEDVDDLVAQRQAANPRRTPGRTPAGAHQTRRLIGVTLAILATVTVLLVAVLTISS